jgi:23S rRNA (guanosine2251-2'-O)-methyltransferase
MAKDGGKRPSGGQNNQGGWQNKPQRGNGYGQGGRGQDARGGYGNRQDRPAQGGGYGNKQDRPAQGGYGNRQDRPAQGGGYGNRQDRPAQGGGYGNRQDRPAQGGYKGKPSYGKPGDSRPAYGKPSYDKPAYDKPGNRPAYNKPGGSAKPYADRSNAAPQGGQQFSRRDDRFADRNSAPRPFAPAPATEAPEQAPQIAPENMLVGRNPIREALKAGRHFEALYVMKGERNGSAQEIIRKARDQRVIVKEVDRRALEAMSPGHQGLIAVVSAHQYASIDDMLALAKQRGEEPMIVLLDGITDPHNFGAIARTAECCGAHGVIVCERRAVGMTPGAAKAAAGAFEYLPIARVANVSRTIDELKEAGLWVYAADQTGADTHYSADLKGPIVLVIGDEGEGISRLALEKCDGRVAIPIRGNIESLNASVAAGILLYEVVRQRDAT